MGDQISISIKIDGVRIPSNQFVKVVDAFYGLIDDVSGEILDGNKLSWSTDVRTGSILMDAIPEPSHQNNGAAFAVTQAVIRGLSTIEEDSVRPKSFTDSALRKAHDLASVVCDTGISFLSVRCGDIDNKISHQTVVHVNAILKATTAAYGTVDGQLQMLTARKGLQFSVYDPVTDRPVTCKFDNNLLEEVIAAFGKRVQVYGKILYRSDGTPNNVVVESFREYKECFPSAQDVRGILQE